MPAVNAVVFFPESSLELQAHLACRSIGDRRDGLLELRREVGVERGKQRKGYGANAEIGVDLAWTVIVLVDHRYPAVALAYLPDRGEIPDLVLQTQGEPSGQLIGPADHLQHAVLVVVVGVQIQPGLRTQQLGEADRLGWLTLEIAGAGLDGVSAAHRAAVLRLVVEGACASQILDQL